MIDFTKLVLEHGRVTCFTIVEITLGADGFLKYSYSDFMLPDGSEDAAFVAYALWVFRAYSHVYVHSAKVYMSVVY